MMFTRRRTWITSHSSMSRQICGILSLISAAVHPSVAIVLPPATSISSEGLMLCVLLLSLHVRTYLVEPESKTNSICPPSCCSYSLMMHEFMLMHLNNYTLTVYHDVLPPPGSCTLCLRTQAATPILFCRFLPSGVPDLPLCTYLSDSGFMHSGSTVLIVRIQVLNPHCGSSLA